MPVKGRRLCQPGFADMAKIICLDRAAVAIIRVGRQILLADVFPQRITGASAQLSDLDGLPERQLVAALADDDRWLAAHYFLGQSVFGGYCYESDAMALYGLGVRCYPFRAKSGERERITRLWHSYLVNGREYREIVREQARCMALIEWDFQPSAD